MKRRYIVFGAVLIVLGVVWALRLLDVIPQQWRLLFPGWWTMFIIVPCLLSLFSRRDRTGPAIGLAVGVLLLLWKLEVLTWGQSWRLMLCSSIVIVGVSLLVGGLTAKRAGARRAISSQSAPKKDAAEPADDPAEEYEAVFATRTLDFAGRSFSGASLTAVFGKLTADFTGAMIAPEAVINVYVIFGAVEISLPENVRAQFRVVPVFGAAGDRRKAKPAKDAPAVNVRGSAVFGGVNVL